jgi:PAS domain S-box-containing protein
MRSDLNKTVKLNAKLITGICLVLAVLILIPFPGFSQRYNFNTYNNTNGMPGNQVNAVMQDSYGRIWVGTMNGITIFDGIKFTGFENNNPISSNPIKSIFEDSKGNVWIGMIRKGLCKFSGTTFEYYNTANGLLSENVNSITEDKKGNIWIGTSEGLNRFDGKIMHSYTTLRGLVNNNIFSVTHDSKGKLWIATLGGISVFDGKDFVNFTTEAGLLSNICYNILEDHQGKMWISTYLGISVFDGNNFKNYTTANGLLTDRIEAIIENSVNKKMFASYGGGIGVIDEDQISYITVEQGLPSNIVKALIQDREGNYWFGTWSGLCKYNGDRFINYTHEDGLANNNILSIAADSSGRVFFGTLTGGVNYTDGSGIFTLGLESGLKGLTIWSIYIKNNNNYWFGTTNGPALLDTATWTFTHPFPELNDMIIYTILEDSKGRLMFGTDKGIYIRNDQGGFKIIGKEQGLDNDKVRVLFEDREERIWIGTLKNINYFEGDKIVNFNDKYNIPDAPVTSIVEDTTGRILVSTYDFGIFVIGNSINANIISHINKKMGLYNDRILFNFLDKNQKLWLGTPFGLDCFSWKSYINTGKIHLEHYDKSNGYPGVETNAACADNSDNVWFASVNGTIKHNIRSAIKLNTIPVLRISGVELFLKTVDWRKKQIPVNPKTGLPENMILSYDNNHIKISYSGIYLTAPEEVKYQHILEGFDENWSPISSQSFANFSNLGPGEYNFKVKCTANGRDWSNTVTYAFVIKPPYWLTPFFYFLYFLAGSSSIFLFLKFRTRNLHKTQIMLRQKVEQRTNELNLKNLELEKLSIVASETDNAVLIFDKDKEIEWANTAYSKMTGYTVDEIIVNRGKKVSDFTFSKEVTSLLDECITQKKSTVFESHVICKSGSPIWTSNMLTPIFDETGQLKKIVVINTDITYRKMMEEKIKESLEEKGLLLREIHHRVKNNLQIIISLFNLQSHYVDDQKAFEALKEGQDRIKSMALIHERFYQNEGLSRIDFDDYIKRLVENLFLSFNISSERIRYVIDAEKISLDIDTAVPCGLIINELVSNSLKHAFREHEHGEVRVSFKRAGKESLVLFVSDSGKGLPSGFNVEESDSLGMQLINALANQLDGKISVVPGNGTTFMLEFTPAHKAVEPVAEPS